VFVSRKGYWKQSPAQSGPERGGVATAMMNVDNVRTPVAIEIQKPHLATASSVKGKDSLPACSRVICKSFCNYNAKRSEVCCAVMASRLVDLRVSSKLPPSSWIVMGNLALPKLSEGAVPCRTDNRFRSVFRIHPLVHQR
jgi:hypothetical protein